MSRGHRSKQQSSTQRKPTRHQENILTELAYRADVGFEPTFQEIKLPNPEEHENEY